jgi:hypothetical protein
VPNLGGGTATKAAGHWLGKLQVRSLYFNHLDLIIAPQSKQTAFPNHREKRLFAAIAERYSTYDRRIILLPSKSIRRAHRGAKPCVV